jgi:nucleotide-binding universal stress UspA family protein
MYQKILVANDGSPGALKALAAAIELAQRDKCRPSHGDGGGAAAVSREHRRG